MAASPFPSLCTLPAYRPFAEDLVEGILEYTGRDDPLVLGRVQLWLPNRRACRAVRDMFLARHGNSHGNSHGTGAVILPRIIPLGDGETDDLVFAIAGLEQDDGDMAETFPATFSTASVLSPAHRLLMLSRLVRAHDPHCGAEQSVLLAGELARLIDHMKTARLELEALRNIDVGDYATHWQEVLEFLHIAIDAWPAILRDNDAVDAVDLRNRVLEARAQLWQRFPPQDIIIAAGSTGSVPASADLLKTIATLPHGTVVLPGLDTNMDDAAWTCIRADHPQYGMWQLLQRMGKERADVAPWPVGHADKVGSARAALLSRALLPAEAVGHYHSPTDAEASYADALEGVQTVECPDVATEATVIALAVRAALAEPDAQVVIITPERTLARRIIASLERYEIAVDDSAGRPLARTPEATFMRLCLSMVARDLPPIETLGALKHPLAACVMPPVQLRPLVRRLEMQTLRGIRLERGFHGLHQLLRTIKPVPPDDLLQLVDRLEGWARPLHTLLQSAQVPVSEMVRAHVTFCEALATIDDTDDGAARLWQGENGRALAGFLRELEQAGDGHLVAGNDYFGIFEALLQTRVVRPGDAIHPRVSILGLLEARLQPATLVIMGGLNEGIWPPEPDTSPWMSRPMMRAIGLPAPEWRVGLSAHDFVQGFCAAERVMLCRSSVAEGTPTVPSRWWRRLEALLNHTDHAALLRADEPWLAWAQQLYTPQARHRRTPAPPCPTPPVAARPRKLSISNIGLLQRDPYAVYARTILSLRPLAGLDDDPDARHRGLIIHDIMEDFVEECIKTNGGRLPDDSGIAHARLLEMGRAHFRPFTGKEAIQAFWWPRFERIARWFIREQLGREREGIIPLLTEVTGTLSVTSAAGNVCINGRADRVDRMDGDGTLVVIEYKTSQAAAAGDKDMEQGLKAQLPLLAWMLECGGFAALKDAGQVQHLEHMIVSGGRVVGETKTLSLVDRPTLLQDTWDGLCALIRKYDDPAQPYLSYPLGYDSQHEGDYDHLARLAEWLFDDGADDEPDDESQNP